MVRGQRQVKPQTLESDGWSWEGRDRREGVPSSQWKLHHPAWTLNRAERDRAQLRERTSAEEISTCWRQSAVWVQRHELPTPQTAIHICQRTQSPKHKANNVQDIIHSPLLVFSIYLAASDLSCSKQDPPCTVHLIDSQLRFLGSVVVVYGFRCPLASETLVL